MSIVQRAHWNFDAPEALDTELLFTDIRQLHRGNSINKPIYDFTTHSRTKETELVEPRKYIIVEGLFALYWDEIAKLLGTKVFVDLGEDICLERRIERDIRERGRTRESVLEQYRTTVLPMAKQHVHPTRAKADIVVTGDDDIANEVSLVMAHILGNAGGSTTR
jgi:uridine kinase